MQGKKNRDVFVDSGKSSSNTKGQYETIKTYSYTNTLVSMGRSADKENEL